MSLWESRGGLLPGKPELEEEVVIKARPGLCWADSLEEAAAAGQAPTGRMWVEKVGREEQKREEEASGVVVGSDGGWIPGDLAEVGIVNVKKKTIETYKNFCEFI